MSIGEAIEAAKKTQDEFKKETGLASGYISTIFVFLSKANQDFKALKVACLKIDKLCRDYLTGNTADEPDYVIESIIAAIRPVLPIINPPCKTQTGCYIKSPAVRTPNGQIYEGKNHGEIIKHIVKDLKIDTYITQDMMGFTASDGIIIGFIDRKEAYKIAYNAGQIKEKHKPNNILLSEDLYFQPCKSAIKGQPCGGKAFTDGLCEKCNEKRKK